MEVLNSGDYKIYNLSSNAKAKPAFLSAKTKKKLEKKGEQNQLDLIQDLHFPTAALRVKVSKDRQYLAAAGTYPPQVKVYDLHQLSLKFERHLEAEVVQFEILSEDYSKLVFLRNDRSVEFHSQGGTYYTLRIPKFGRDFVYQSDLCNMYIGAATPDVYRLNLEQGQFLQSFTTKLPAVNVCQINPVHQLLAFGGENSVFECWDPRNKNCVGSVDIEPVITPFLENSEIDDNVVLEISSLQFGQNGMTMAVGTSTGQCLLYDIRMQKPLYIKDHQYGLPLHTIIFCDQDVISVDKKILKIWDKQTGKVKANIESPTAINDCCLFPNSGLLIFACEQPKVLPYFLPKLGPAPRWASYLDNVTEELEEEKQTIYESYKFVTREELESLGLTRLIGTEYLKAYMHGFFMDSKYYNKLRSLAEPFEYDKYKREKVKEKLEKEAASRISVKKKMPKVNAKLAARLTMEGPKKKGQSSLLEDERFKSLFENPDFLVDEQDEKYQLYHRGDKSLTKEDIEDQFEPVSEDEEVEQNNDFFSDEEEEEEKEEQDQPELSQSRIPERQAQKPKKITLYELKKGSGSAAASSEKNLPLGLRLTSASKTTDQNFEKSTIGATQETFVLQGSAKKDNKKEASQKYLSRISKKRGTQDLNLPKFRPQTKRKKLK